MTEKKKVSNKLKDDSVRPRLKQLWLEVKQKLAQHIQQTQLYQIKSKIRQISLFSRRKSRSLVNRILSLLMVWGVMTYLLAVAAIWWGSTKVIEDNFSYQASEWLKKMDELGTPLYATDDKSLFRSIEDHVSRFPEMSYLRYYDAEKNTIIAEYKAKKIADYSIALLSDDDIKRLKSNVDRQQPLFIHSFKGELSLMQAAAPIVIRSFKSDALLDFDMNQDASENYKVIGFIELGLDFGVYREQLVRNIYLGSLLMAVLFVMVAFIGRMVLKTALNPLSDLRKPLARLAEGDINVQVKGEGDQEIVSIANALNTTIEALKSRDDELQKMANYDGLTGLLNKYNFNIQLQHEINRIQQQQDSSALMFIDLDQFKYINDTLGHPAGDRLLVQIAELLNKRMRRDDVIARFGGDEFTVIVKSVSATEAETVANSIVKSMQSFIFMEKEQAFNVYCSVGVVMISPNGLTLEEVFSHADMACYQAKASGRNCYSVYDPQEQEALKKTADIGWTKRLKDAIEHDQFSLFFQPIISLRNHEQEYYEVLLRMQLDDEEIIYPNSFLPAAERLGLAVDIDYLVLSKTLELVMEVAQRDKPFTLSVNLSNRVFEAPGLVENIRNIFDAYKVSPTTVVFEITEQTAIRQLERARQCITELSALGFRFALDDFGSGFSSFNYLKNLPVDIVKIDGGFIKQLANDPVDQAMVQSMIQIAHTLGKETVAEHVQDAASLDILKVFGVDYVQGFYLSKPKASISEIDFSEIISCKL